MIIRLQSSDVFSQYCISISEELLRIIPTCIQLRSSNFQLSQGPRRTKLCPTFEKHENFKFLTSEFLRMHTFYAKQRFTVNYWRKTLSWRIFKVTPSSILTPTPCPNSSSSSSCSASYLIFSLSLTLFLFTPCLLVLTPH